MSRLLNHYQTGENDHGGVVPDQGSGTYRLVFPLNLEQLFAQNISQFCKGGGYKLALIKE